LSIIASEGYIPLRDFITVLRLGVAIHFKNETISFVLLFFFCTFATQTNQLWNTFMKQGWKCAIMNATSKAL
jgi:hypothetical protein